MHKRALDAPGADRERQHQLMECIDARDVLNHEAFGRAITARAAPGARCGLPQRPPAPPAPRLMAGSRITRALLPRLSPSRPQLEAVLDYFSTSVGPLLALAEYNFACPAARRICQQTGDGGRVVTPENLKARPSRGCPDRPGRRRRAPGAAA